jgi:hypothetical protein
MNKEHHRNREARDSMDHCITKRSQQGTCHDCAQGCGLSRIKDGFAYWDQDGDGRGFWFCCFCGSNHVTVYLENGEEVEQGDLYDDDGMPRF